MRIARSLTLAFAVSTLSFAAHAADTVFMFTAKVDSSTLSGVTVGDAVTGTFQYDLSRRGISHKADQSTYYFAHAEWGAFQAQVGGHQLSAASLGVDVFNDQGGNIEDMILINGYGLKVDDTVYSDGAMSISLSTRPGNTGALQGVALPSVYDLSSFDEYNGWVRVDGSQSGGLLTFTALSITAVPEVSGVWMGLVGLLGVAAIRMRTRPVL